MVFLWTLFYFKAKINIKMLFLFWKTRIMKIFISENKLNFKNYNKYLWFFLYIIIVLIASYWNKIVFFCVWIENTNVKNIWGNFGKKLQNYLASLNEISSSIFFNPFLVECKELHCCNSCILGRPIFASFFSSILWSGPWG